VEEPLILDRYRPLTDLGAGGHGWVVLAFDTKMARRVAIKRLPLPHGRAAVRTGLAEARTAAMLNHPHIVTVHEWEADDEAAYLVMEHIDGLSLADLLDSLGAPLDDDEAATIVRAVGDALSFAHRNGVLHLDVKPGNVLIDREGRVKIADFGIAALTGSGGSARGSGGTIGYMPPEQIRGESLDDATDEWAFAALVYELLTLANPFDADTPEGSLFKIEVADLPAPSEFVHDLPKGIDAVLLAALAADPAERYPSVGDLTTRLLDFLGDPLAGEEALAGDVAYFVADEEEAEEEAFERLGAWDRLAPQARTYTRVGAALACGWLAWAGLAPFGLGSAVALGATALVALAALLAPALGFALGVVTLTAGLVVRSGIGWAALFAVPAVAYWAWRGRRGEGDTLVVLGAPVLGVVRAAGATPLLAGFVYGPLAALAASALAALATMVVSAATGAAPPFLSVDWRFFTDPWSAEVLTANIRTVFATGPLVAAAGWGVAGAVMSLFCARGTRMAASLGALVAAAVLRVAYVPWRLLPDGPSLTSLLTYGGAALIVIVVVIALGPPTRGE
jgi:hypothetical protein